MERKELIEIVHQTRTLVMDEANSRAVTAKGTADFVTKVDFSVQDFLKKILFREYPGISLMSEEQKENEIGPDTDTWILDPIDGTTNLIHHYQHSAVSLGLYEQGEITLGVVYNPFTDETFSAAKGCGAYLNEQKIQVTDQNDMLRTLISMGTDPYEKEKAPENFALFQKVFMECTDIRISGSAALDLCYVACGRLDTFLERNLKPWDYGAGSLILTEAGGKITDWNNQPLSFDRNCNVLATNGLLHSYFLENIVND
ncbi:inositol monophosphatase family protein [Diplocloster agilis]|uniref:inositol monophosphatase family protein n=1 Tax=Diplocloster agilis TaxID=2850323 RepID=UPI000820593D|nr:inositol monophosphatase family protein [Suonthocola fibrivorans]MCU6736714.1 inositol monophosphatase [Suonthocola fibrivorans]SCJ93058.1 Inositol-1-monophosphatase [uncultured Clostridium sp.]